MVGLTSFNVFLDDFFYYFENEAVHNIADDNTLPCFAKTINGPIILLKVESDIAMKWIYKNKMNINHENSYQQYWLKTNQTIYQPSFLLV